MADLSSTFLGIKSPNPFWLASAPPTDKAYNVNRAFEAGWGGVVWKTLGEDPPIVNVSGPRYGALHTLRPPADRLQQHRADHRPAARASTCEEIRQVKRDWPDRALVVSLMVPCEERRVEDDPADGRGHRRRRHRAQLRLPARHVRARHGRGGRPGARVRRDGHALVQAVQQAAGDRQAHAQRHRHPQPGARGQARRRRRRLADQHHQLDHGRGPRPVSPEPAASTARARTAATAGRRSSRSRCTWWPRSRATRNAPGLPISGIGGIATWRDAAEFMALGAGNVQVCTAAMVYGFKIVEDMIDGLSNWMDEQGLLARSTTSSARPCRTSSTGST